MKGKMPTLDLFSVQTKRSRLSFIVFVERFALSQTPEATCSRDGHAADVNMSQILYFKGARPWESHVWCVCFTLGQE